MPQCWPRIRQVLEVRRSAPVLQIREVGDKRGLAKELLGREVGEVLGVGEGLNELCSCESGYQRAEMCMVQCTSSYL